MSIVQPYDGLQMTSNTSLVSQDDGSDLVRSTHQKESTSKTQRRVRTWHLILLSAVLHLVLLFYADHVDSQPERYGGLKYTDVDWRVVMDGARLMFGPRESEGAQGVLGRWAWANGWKIGDPYRRQTFRYTPLLPLLTSPSLIHPLLGKILLSLISLSIPLLLLCEPHPTSQAGPKSSYTAAPFWATHLVWTLNPFVLNITTRGSPEAIIVFLVVLTLTLLRLSTTSRSVHGRFPNPDAGGSKSAVAFKASASTGQGYEDAAAVAFALAISYKIYPIIYAPAFWAFLRQRHGLLGAGVWRFGIITAVSLAIINGALYAIWGHPFLEHTFLYHLQRKDHRHNFSPYFYPIYLSLFATPPTLPHSTLDTVLSFFRHPLASFIPQATLVLGSGWTLTPVAGLPFAMFVQTVAFVIFNKVCTSQYFMWFLALIPPVIPQLSVTPRRATLLVGVWIAGQAIWLGMAYRLELLAQDAYLAVWAAGIGLFGGSVWVLGELVDACLPIVPALDVNRKDQ